VSGAPFRSCAVARVAIDLWRAAVPDGLPLAFLLPTVGTDVQEVFADKHKIRAQPAACRRTTSAKCFRSRTQACQLWSRTCSTTGTRCGS
jgi:hypothetical protein